MNYILRDTEKYKQNILILCFLSCLFMKLTKMAHTSSIKFHTLLLPEVWSTDVSSSTH